MSSTSDTSCSFEVQELDGHMEDILRNRPSEQARLALVISVWLAQN